MKGREFRLRLELFPVLEVETDGYIVLVTVWVTGK